MSLYLITYHQTVHNHDVSHNVSGKVRSFGSWAHIMPSAWLVSSEMNAEEMNTSIKEVIDPTDLLFVTKVTKDHAACVHPDALAWAEEKISE